MKNISRYLSLAVIALLLSSCSDFLEEHNATGISDLCSSEETMEAAMLGIQHGFVTEWDGLSGMGAIYLDYASGLSTWHKDNYIEKAEYVSLLNLTYLKENDGGVFSTFYKVISRANDILDNLPSSKLDETFKLEMEAEAKFYRGVAYFYLVRIFGDVPLRVKISTAEDASNCPRTKYDLIYQQVVSDLEFAAKNMRSPQRVREVAVGYPRVNKYAAVAYLSEVYCTIGSLLASPDDNFWNPDKPERVPDFTAIGVDKNYETGARQAYEKALYYAEKLIPESPSHDPGCDYQLVEKFGDLFNFDPDFSRNGYTAYLNPEQIFVMPGTITSGMMSPYVQYRLPQYAEGTSCTTSNPNAGRCKPTRFLFQKWCSTYPGKVAAQFKDNAYETSLDPRLDLSFYHGVMARCDGAGNSTFYPLTTSTSTNNNSPYYKKTASKRGQVTLGDSDLYLMRLGQVYLIAAEAAAYLDDETTAREYIEVLHARARHSVYDGDPDATMPSWEGKTFADKQELLDAIFWENEFELAGESHDYFNTHRHGARWMIKNICIPNNEFWALSDNKSYHDAYFGSFKYQENYQDNPQDVGGDVYKTRKCLLFSFPNSEQNYNTAISVEQAKNDYNYDR